MAASSWWKALAAAAGAAAGYAIAVEPYRLELREATISLPRLPEEFDGFRILQISDLHMRQIGRRERVLMRMLSNLPQADLAAFTGDMVHTAAGIEPFLALAASVNADLSAAIFGNSEHKNGVEPTGFARALRAAGIEPLLNRHTVLSRGKAALAIAGVDDPVNEQDDLPLAVSGLGSTTCTVLLMHSPDGIAEAALHGIDLVLSGHTHGGQIAFPIIGAPYTHCHLGPRMSAGYYAGRKLRKVVGIRTGRTQLYVTRGIGVSGLSMRFLCRPEVTLLTLRRGVPSIR